MGEPISDWEQIRDSTGGVIYFNRATGERRSDNPGSPLRDASPKEATPVTFVAAGLTFDYFKEVFNIDYEEVKDRVIFAINPLNEKFFSLIEYHPDLYGPFWIATTLIFVVAAAGNLSLALSDAQMSHSYAMITKAVGVIYAVAFGIPAALWGAMKLFGSESRYSQVTCLYGYSLVVYLPVTLLCVLPNDGIRWLVLIYGVGSSTMFLLSNLKKELEKYMEARKYIVLALVLCGQLILGLTFKLYFFKYIYASKQEIF